jgi:hypothetical protein
MCSTVLHREIIRAGEESVTRWTAVREGGFRLNYALNLKELMELRAERTGNQGKRCRKRFSHSHCKKTSY